MNHDFHISAEPRDPVDLDRVVAALLALAVARLEERAAGSDDDDEPEAADA